MTIQKEIRQLCRQKNAIIMGHYYQRDEIQDVADFIGDSLALAQKAKQTSADIIVMCGVHFMAETVKILCPNRKVLIPDPTAGCSLADSCSAEDLRRWKEEHPEHTIVSYVNTSVEVKALTDIIVTSGNALKIVNRLPKDAKILFGPDQNLGRYICEQTGREMELWHGGCHVHGRFSASQLREMKQAHPNVKVLAHPECKQDILAQSDVIGSTLALLNYVKAHPEEKQFIIATESGVIHEMQKACPDSVFLPVPAEGSPCGSCNECEYMRQNTLVKLRDCLRDETGEIILDADIAAQALKPIEKMLEWSK